MFIGLGTAVNVVAVVIGSTLGVLAGHRLPHRTRDLVTQVLGLVTLVIGGLSVASGMSEAFTAEVGAQARLLIILGSLLIGGIIGSLLQIEHRLDRGAELLHDRFASASEGSTFVEGAVTATLVFCVGPLSILGSLSDGLGQGAEQLLVKSIMDGFASIAFAASLGIGVMAAAIPLALYQGLLTLLGFALGNFLPAGQVDAIGATGGVILLGLGFRLAGIKQIPVGDLLPALVVAPLLTALVGAFV
ncbi:MAG TPA: DUF554 domain-containing protein [Propionicimonas sp.]|nr:DUF554 domain-containing protein [Propionicimonas sp.]HRA05762.1 DUF554 domain-containing protein [Propionicimonas sp.]